jgi:hypothetical protein
MVMERLLSSSDNNQRRIAMKVYVGFDVAAAKTAVCVMDETGKVLWETMVKTHPLTIAGGLKRTCLP